MENTTAPQPSMEDLVRRVLECIGSNAAQIAPPPSIGAIPEFSGEDIGEDATLWCNRVEEITKDVPRQRLNLATHVLTGPAKEWYRRWEAHPCTWEQFREDLCAVFVSERKLHDRLMRALQYTSDPATSYVEYARTKLTYLRQTQVSFTTAQQIELIVSTISDSNVRQAMLNGRYETTADLMVGIAEYKKTIVLKRTNYDDKAHGSSYKRCYTCDEAGHIARMCLKKPRTDRRTSPSRSPPRRIITCTYCSKRGHEEANCWAKERAARKNQSNVCFSMDHKLTPIILRDTLVRQSLIDSGATCSLVEEDVAKRANCAINPFVTTVRGLSDSSATTVGSTTTVIQAEGISVELDLFVVPDSAIPYDLIIGKNVLAAGGIKIVTDEDGSTRLQRVPTVQNGTEGIEALCYATDGVDEKTREAVAELLNRYRHMITTGSKVRRTKIEYLGREISAEGIRPGEAKIKSLLEAPIPENVKQVRQFMGLASYFRKFIPEFAVRTACITKLTKKDEQWKWGDEQEEARKYILKKLCTKPLLVIFDPTRETKLHTDASSLGYGAILFQRVDGDLRVVAYFSRRTTTEESRYHSYELETLAIVNALKYFRVYLLGLNFKIITDCNAVKATGTKKDLIPRVARWWIFLQDYTFELEYRKGKLVEHVDYLSRNPRQDYRVNLICEGSWLEIAQRKDNETNDTIQKLNAGHSVSSDFEMRHGILCRKIRPKQGFLHSIPKKCTPFDTIHCDCVGPFEITKEGYQHILLIVDAFTKYLQLIPLKTLSGPEMLAIFRERLTLFGTPRVVAFDRGTNFTYKPLKLFIEKHGSQVHFIATGAPRANGQAERYVATVTNLLSIETKKGTEWPNKLAKLMLSLNTTVQKSTGFSPSRLLFGLETGPGNVMHAEEHLPANDRIDVVHDRSVAAKRLKENAVSQEARFNRTRIDNIKYKEGDAIFLKPAGNRKAKLDAKYTGPFTIVKILPNDRYEIIGKSGRPQIAPKDRLRAWKGEWEGDFESSDNDTESTDEPC
ncbi:Transposon Tf2-6 polyprotein [Anthophora retusa]